tara:strand:- start:1768 stop:2778 length:1011 start_codon:yes stop_codon:yes gene_type:complete
MKHHSKRIAVIGGGMAGVSCAKALAAAGANVVLFEKSRGLGGRLATRRFDSMSQADHGAQFFTATSPSFQSYITTECQAGRMASWAPTGKTSPAAWFVGQPTMNSSLKNNLDGITVRLNSRVASLQRIGARWRLDISDTTDPLMAQQDFQDFDVVVCTAPAPQAQHLLMKSLPDLAEKLSAVEFAPCWALMLTFETPLATGFDVWRAPQNPETPSIISWAARTSHKQGRERGKDSWTIHATESWTADHLEDTPTTAAKILRHAFAHLSGATLPAPVHWAAHRWCFARTVTPLGRSYLGSDCGSLFAGGDWCLGPRLENAFESGRAIAKAILDQSPD